MRKGRRAWGIARTAWVVSPLIAALTLAPALEAKRIRIKRSDLVEPSDSLVYHLEPFPYRIAPGDRLFVDYGLVLDARAITAEAVVRPDGAVTLPRVGDVMVAGYSTAEVDSVLAELYSDVYVEPDITVSVMEVAGNLVHVLGEVQRPGSYEMQPNLTALQAIALAGGFQQDASKGEVLVLRRTGPQQVVARAVDLHDAVKNGRASQDVFLRRYDIVYVNRSAIGNVNLFVDRFIAKMSAIPTLYIRGWEVFNIDRVFPAREPAELRP